MYTLLIRWDIKINNINTWIINIEVISSTLIKRLALTYHTLIYNYTLFNIYTKIICNEIVMEV
jgi:hypothetical protein